MTRPVTALLAPRSVAVIGASADPLKRGFQAIRRLQEDGFAGPVYPVNPQAEEILGLRCYPEIGAIEGDIDLALVVTPAALVPELLQACGRKGVGAAVVIAVGFGETGDSGRALEDAAAAVASEHGIALVGPNTNGVFNLHRRLNLVGAADVPMGRVALVCQSGNMALSLFTDAAAAGTIGYSSYIGIGNEAGLRYHELLPYLGEDPDTDAVLMYVEGFRDGAAFLASARTLSRRKPITLYKAGRSDAGRRSALSHTGAITGRPDVADALLRQAGVHVVERADELLPVCEAVTRQPPLDAPRIAVLADGGGHATVAADALSRNDLLLATLGEDTRRRLTDLLPSAASTANPVDVAGATDRDPSLFEACIQHLLEDPAVAGVLCVGLFGGYGIRFSSDLAIAEDDAAEAMGKLADAHGKPLLVQSAYAHSRPRAHDLLRQAGVPVHSSVETAVRCLVALAERGRWLATADGRSDLRQPERPQDLGRRALSEPAGRELLTRHGIDVGRWMLARDPQEAARAAEALGTPVAMKIVSSQVVHKSDVGGVLLDVAGAEDARTGFDHLLRRISSSHPDADIDGVLVAPMAPRGLELIVGASIDPTFGAVLTVGAGGTAVELTGDVAFRAVPVTALECREMLAELAISPLLDGYRGAPRIDRERVVQLLLRVSRLMVAEPQIIELDLNPVIAHGDGLELVDVRAIVADHADATVGSNDHDRADVLSTPTEPRGVGHQTAQ